MFSVVPFAARIGHVDISLWETAGGGSEYSDYSGEPSIHSGQGSELSSPLLHRSFAPDPEAALTSKTILAAVDVATGPANILVITDIDNPSATTEQPALSPLPPPVQSDSSGAVTVDSAISSLPQSPSYEETERESIDSKTRLTPGISSTVSLLLPEPTQDNSSIDSALYSLPTELVTTEHKQEEENTATHETMINTSAASARGGGRRKLAANNRGKCPRCGKVVYFAERKVAMGHQWHQRCFRCATCGRFLDPGRHSEHEGKPYCNHCYKTNFGPDGFRMGVAQPRPVFELPPQSAVEKNEILARIEAYNLYKEHVIEHIKHKEAQGRIFFEGVLKLYWGLKKHIVLASGSSNNYGRQRARESSYNYISIDDEGFDRMIANAESDSSVNKDELQRYMELAQYSLGTEELISKGLNEASIEAFAPNGDVTDGGVVGTIREETDTPQEEYVLIHNESDEEFSGPEERGCQSLTNSPSKQRVVYRQKSDVSEATFIPRTTSVRRRSASFRKVQKYKRQEAREEKRSKFVPPYGKHTNVRVSNMQRTTEVLDMLLLKYNVENKSSEFTLMVVHDNGAMEPLDISDSPLSVRLKLGPNEDVAKIYVMEADSVNLQISQETAEYLSFQLPELNQFLKKFEEEEEREKKKVESKFEHWKEAIREMQHLKNPSLLSSNSQPIEQQA